MRTSRIAIAIASCIAITAFACSSPDVPSREQDPKRETSTNNPDRNNGGATNNNNGGSTTPGGGETTTPGGGNTNPAPTNDGAACLAKANGEACFECCDAIDPKAFEAATKAADDCLCNATTGPCKTPCGTNLCQGKEPSDACFTCMEGQPAAKCNDTFKTTCEASAGCKTVMECSKKCADKFPMGDN